MMGEADWRFQTSFFNGQIQLDSIYRRSVARATREHNSSLLKSFFLNVSYDGVLSGETVKHLLLFSDNGESCGLFRAQADGIALNNDWENREIPIDLQYTQTSDFCLRLIPR